MSAKTLNFQIVTYISTHNTKLIPAHIFTLVLFHQFPVSIPKRIIGEYEELKNINGNKSISKNDGF
jgi:hypothetical protein